MPNANDAKTEAKPRPFEPPPTTGDERLDACARLLAIVDRLRAPDGCPWDLEQTVESMAPSLIEEAFEAVEAIERKDDQGTVEELGDVLLVIVLIARIAADEERFEIASALRHVSDKLIRRHPHVFGDLELRGSDQALANWGKIKQAERRAKDEDASSLAGVPLALPVLQRAARLCGRAVSAGFKWSDASGALAKLKEEVAELEEAMAQPERPERIEAELGDVLLAASFLGQYLGHEPERATRQALRRFEARFRRLEAQLGERMADTPLPELLVHWERAKRLEDAD